MKKLLVATALLILGTAGTAAADRYRDGRGDRRERVTVRDRGNYNNNRGNRQVVRDRGWNNRQVRDRGNWNNRRPVYVNNDRFNFQGRSVVYRRPVIHQRHYNYQVRPTVLLENYETVPGYAWVAGNWQWNGYEWSWVNGHYEVDGNYYNDNVSYDNVSYDNVGNDSYYNSSGGCDH